MLKFHCVHACTKRHSGSEMAMVAELSGHVYRCHSRHPYRCLQSTGLLLTSYHAIYETCSKKHSSLIGIMLPHCWILQLLHSDTLYPPRTFIYTTNRSVPCLSVLADMKLTLLDTSSTVPMVAFSECSWLQIHTHA